RLILFFALIIQGIAPDLEELAQAQSLEVFASIPADFGPGDEDELPQDVCVPVSIDPDSIPLRADWKPARLEIAQAGPGETSVWPSSAGPAHASFSLIAKDDLIHFLCRQTC